MADEKEITSPLPISFKDVRKYPVAAMLFLCLIAISVLYVRSERQNKARDDERMATIQLYMDRTDRLNTEVSFLKEQVRRSDSALASVTATLKVLEKYGKISQ